MKNFILPLLLSSIWLTNSAFSFDDTLLAVNLTITSSTTPDDLENMQAFMKDNNYSLVFEEVVFDDQGRLSSIKGEVDFGKSSGNFYASDLSQSVLVIKKSVLGRVSIEVKPNE